MSTLATVEREMIVSRPIFETVSPGWTGLLRGQAARVAKVANLGVMALKNSRAMKDRKKRPSDVVGEIAANHVMKYALSPVRTQVNRAHKHVQHSPKRDFFRHNGLGGRGWFYEPGRKQMVIVFHDANKAGAHIDIHLGRVSMIRRVKPEIYSQLKFNNNGYLTQSSKKILVDFLKEEIDNGARIPQNLDHSLSNARASWTGGSREDTHYGAATTRQVVLEETVDVYKAHANGPIEFWSPSLNPHRGMYVYKLDKGDAKRAPILIWGNLKSNPPPMEDRLHLKLAHPEEADKVTLNADMSTTTAKLDGSSAYFITDKKGTRVYSPRFSVKTGERIEYTFKTNGMANITSDERIVGMGELLFKEKRANPLKKNNYLPQSQIGGILNSNSVLPKNVTPELHIYRIDKVGRKRTTDLDFWSNRELQERTAKLSKHLKVVELMSPEKVAKHGFEGYVAVPESKSVNEGYKVKFWQDPADWRIDRIGFYPGPKGGLAGVIYCTSLESGRTYKLGPGSVGDRTLTEHMMNNPSLYEGVVIKTLSKTGHDGRATTVVGLHQDKGLAAF